jgi:hypothetical protein
LSIFGLFFPLRVHYKQIVDNNISSRATAPCAAFPIWRCVALLVGRLPEIFICCVVSPGLWHVWLAGGNVLVRVFYDAVVNVRVQVCAGCFFRFLVWLVLTFVWLSFTLPEIQKSLSVCEKQVLNFEILLFTSFILSLGVSTRLDVG